MTYSWLYQLGSSRENRNDTRLWQNEEYRENWLNRSWRTEQKLWGNTEMVPWGNSYPPRGRGGAEGIFLEEVSPGLGLRSLWRVAARPGLASPELKGRALHGCPWDFWAEGAARLLMASHMAGSLTPKEVGFFLLSFSLRNKDFQIITVQSHRDKQQKFCQWLLGTMVGKATSPQCFLAHLLWTGVGKHLILIAEWKHILPPVKAEPQPFRTFSLK